MPPRKSDSCPSPDLSTLAGRIAWLLFNLFGGNLRRMAEAVGLSHTVLSKVIGCRQGAGRRTIEAIASHPRVNPGWLLDGDGEPLLATRHDAPGEGWPVPVSRVILPGLPARHPELLTGATFPLAGTFYGPTRYWLRVADNDPITREPAEKVAPGDMLLLEADAGYWRADRRVLADRLVALRIRGRGGPSYALARCRLDSTAGERIFRIYGVGDEPVVPPHSVSPFDSRQGRAIELSEADWEDQPRDPTGIADAPRSPALPRRTVREVFVGVCILILRP